METPQVKSEIVRAIQDLPEDATVEDAMERLYFLAKIERGLEQSESDETISHDEIKARFLKCLKFFGGRRREKFSAILSAMEQQELIEKIKRLSQDSIAEVEDFVDSLAVRECSLNRTSLHQALANYAIQRAGTDVDLDSDLEAAATDHLLQQNPEQ